MNLDDCKQITSFDLLGLFVCHEFEVIAADILKFLSNDQRLDSIPDWLRYGSRQIGWHKVFYLRDVTDDTGMFAAMCAAGWLQHVWFPKRAFMVTDDFRSKIERDDAPKDLPIHKCPQCGLRFVEPGAAT